MVLSLALAVKEAVAGHRLGALEGGGLPPRPLQCIPRGGGGVVRSVDHETRHGGMEKGPILCKRPARAPAMVPVHVTPQKRSGAEEIRRAAHTARRP